MSNSSNPCDVYGYAISIVLMLAYSGVLLMLMDCYECFISGVILISIDIIILLVMSIIYCQFTQVS